MSPFTIQNLARKLILAVVVGIIAMQLVSFFTHREPSSPPSDARFRNTSLPISERVSDLLSYMTLAEKIGQMALVEKNSLRKDQDIATYGLGGMLSGFGGKPENNTPLGWREMIRRFIDTSQTSRLGIPLLYGVDAIHGHSNVPGATIFPHFIALGATRDEKLVERVAAATSNEIMETGANWSYSPTYDMPEDIRWGRVYETFSDDPALVSTLGAAYIRGLQQRSTPTSTIKLLATPKHFIGAGSMVWGSSSNENFKIDQGTTPINEEKLATQYLPPFKDAIDAGAQSIMVGLNSWGNTKLAASEQLVTTELKDKLGFTGFTVSDWYGVYEIPGGDYAAAVTAINAGIDMVMLPFAYKEFIDNVTDAVENGEIDESRIDDAVGRILRAKFALGLFDTTISNPDDTLSSIGSEQHRALAREAVAKSQVLLKNSNNLLPITTKNTRIYVAGSAAHNIGIQSGAWTIEWQGVDGNWLPGATSILDGIRSVAPLGTVVEYNQDGNFSQTSAKADIGIAIVGESPYAEGWGDNDKPSLSAADLQTISNLQKSSKKIVVILVTGRPLFITDEMQSWDALIAAWLPGSEGAGVADTLFGILPYTGALPLPWPRTTAQLPIDSSGVTNDGTMPLFPRYYGL